jgi:hypothetical protein
MVQDQADDLKSTQFRQVRPWKMEAASLKYTGRPGHQNKGKTYTPRWLPVHTRKGRGVKNASNGQDENQTEAMKAVSNLDTIKVLRPVVSVRMLEVGVHVQGKGPQFVIAGGSSQLGSITVLPGRHRISN